MVFKELAHMFSDDDNQRRSREVLNRVSTYTLFVTLNSLRLKSFEFLLYFAALFVFLLNCRDKIAISACL